MPIITIYQGASGEGQELAEAVATAKYSPFLPNMQPKKDTDIYWECQALLHANADFDSLVLAVANHKVGVVLIAALPVLLPINIFAQN